MLNQTTVPLKVRISSRWVNHLAALGYKRCLYPSSCQILVFQASHSKVNAGRKVSAPSMTFAGHSPLLFFQMTDICIVLTLCTGGIISKCRVWVLTKRWLKPKARKSSKQLEIYSCHILCDEWMAEKKKEKDLCNCCPINGDMLIHSDRSI